MYLVFFSLTVYTQQFSHQQPLSQQNRKAENSVETAFPMTACSTKSSTGSDGNGNGNRNDLNFKSNNLNISSFSNNLNGKYSLSRSATDGYNFHGSGCGSGNSSSNSNSNSNGNSNSSSNSNSNINSGGPQPVYSMMAGSFSLSKKSISTPPSILSSSYSTSSSISPTTTFGTPTASSIDMTDDDDDDDINSNLEILESKSTISSYSINNQSTQSTQPMCISNPYRDNSVRSSTLTSTSTSTSSTTLPTEAQWGSITSKISSVDIFSRDNDKRRKNSIDRIKEGRNYNTNSNHSNSNISNNTNNDNIDNNDNINMSGSISISGKNNNCSGIFQIPGSSSVTPGTPSTPAFDFYGSQPRTERDVDSDISNSPERNSMSSSSSGNEEGMDSDNSPSSSVEKETKRGRGMGAERENEKVNQNQRGKEKRKGKGERDEVYDRIRYKPATAEIKGTVRKSLENLLGVKNVLSGLNDDNRCEPFDYVALGISEHENKNEKRNKNENDHENENESESENENKHENENINDDSEIFVIPDGKNVKSKTTFATNYVKRDFLVISDDGKKTDNNTQINMKNKKLICNKENVDNSNSSSNGDGNINTDVDIDINFYNSNSSSDCIGVHDKKSEEGKETIHLSQNRDRTTSFDATDIQDTVLSVPNASMNSITNKYSSISTYSSVSTVQGMKRKMCDTVAITTDTKGKGKRVKSTMRVASIKSFFTSR